MTIQVGDGSRGGALHGNAGSDERLPDIRDRTAYLVRLGAKHLYAAQQQQAPAKETLQFFHGKTFERIDGNHQRLRLRFARKPSA